MKTQSLLTLLIATLASTLLLTACGGDGGLEAASEQLSSIQQEVADARTAVETREAETSAANEALEAARETLADAEKRLADAQREVADAASDPVLFRAVQQRLLDARDLEGLAVSARVQKRVVTLEGSVPGEAQKRRAEEIASETTGVETVINQIRVTAAAPAEE